MSYCGNNYYRRNGWGSNLNTATPCNGVYPNYTPGLCNNYGYGEVYGYGRGFGSYHDGWRNQCRDPYTSIPYQPYYAPYYYTLQGLR